MGLMRSIVKGVWVYEVEDFEKEIYTELDYIDSDKEYVFDKNCDEWKIKDLNTKLKNNEIRIVKQKNIKNGYNFIIFDGEDYFAVKL